MRKQFFLFTLLLCLCANAAWAARYGQLIVHVVLDNTGEVDKAGIAKVDATEGTKTNNPTGFVENGSKTLSYSSSLAPWDITRDYVAYAYPMNGYKVVGWSIDSKDNAIASSYQFYKSNYTASSSDSGSPTTKNIYVHIAVDDNPVSYNFSGSYTPQAGSFILLNYGTNQFLTATSTGLGVTKNQNSATIFHLTNGSSSSLEYKDNNNTYYLIHKNGTFQANNTTSKDWTIENSDVSNYYRFKLKNTDNDRFIYIDGFSGNVSMPRSDEWTEYSRSWALIPVYYFEEGTPSIIGGTATWSVDESMIIPTSSATINSATTNATFSATPATGYTFKGWWNNSSFTGDMAFADQSYEDQEITNSNPNAAYPMPYPKFVPNFYFSANVIKNREDGGTVTAKIESGEAAAAVTYDYEATDVGQTSQTVSVTYKAVSAGGFNFAGWYDNAECTGDFLEMDSTYETTITDNNVGSTTRVNKTVYAKFVTEKVPVFTWNNSSVIVSRNYPSVFSSTNSDNAYTITSNDETVAKVIDGTLYAYKEGTVTFTVTQAAGNDWIEHTETFVVTVNPAPDWGWISEEPATDDFYIRVKNSNKYMNNDNSVGGANTVWTLTKTNETLTIVDKEATSKFLEVQCVEQNAGFNLSRFRVYSDGRSNSGEGDSKFTKTVLTLGGSLDGGYALFADDINYGNSDGINGWGAQRRDVYVCVNEDNDLIPQESGNPWEFISKAQYDARVAYQNAATFAAIADNHLSNSLRAELTSVMEANSDESTNYTNKHFATCKTNLDAIVAKCSTYVANLQNTVPVPLHRDNSGNGYYMFYDASQDARLGDDVQAYTAAWSDNNSLTLTAVPNQVIPKGHVALVYSNIKSEFYYAFEAAAASPIDGNAFVHHSSDYVNDNNHTDYILTAQKENDEVTSYAFCKFTGNNHSLLQDRNVLVWENSNGATAPSVIRIVTEENIATALVPVYGEDATQASDNANGKKLLIDGKLYIQQGNNLYDALGRKVQ